MNISRLLGSGVLVCGLAAMLSSAASGQAIRVNRRQLSINPDTAVKSLTVSVSPSSVSFTLVSNGVASGSGAIQVVTTWKSGSCAPSCTVNLYGYFSSASAALTAGTGANIPSSAVLGKVPTGTPTTFTAFTQTGALGGAGTSLLLFSDVIMTHTAKESRTDALNLEINLSSEPQLAAGTYTGTLYIQAQTL
jgi:hypothetical protein